MTDQERIYWPLLFRVTRHDGSVLIGHIQGNGGRISGCARHLGVKRQTELAIKAVQETVRRAVEGEDTGWYTPEPECAWLWTNPWTEENRMGPGPRTGEVFDLGDPKTKIAIEVHHPEKRGPECDFLEIDLADARRGFDFED